MTSSNYRTVKRNVSLLNLADELCNIYKGCKMMGVYKFDDGACGEADTDYLGYFRS